LSHRSDQLEKVFAAGASRLLGRATDNHGLTGQVLAPRVAAAVEKYVLRDEPDAPADSIVEFIDKLQADDLCLIVACEHGNQAAWNDLVERFSATVRSAARSASSNEESAEDLAQSIWAELHGLRARDDGRPAGKLAYYSGRGSLAGWLRAVVAQLAIDQHRKESRLVQTEEDADFDRIVQHNQEEKSWSGHVDAPNPEIEISRKFAGAQLQTALAQAIKTLPGDDRLLIKLYYFDGLRLREAGAVLGVHEATASRRLTRLHRELRQQVEKNLVESEGWTKSEAERAFAEIAFNLEADIEPMLSSDGILAKKENEIARLKQT
jgi:RNA polymerase sigma-70 factor (ECF subfamily)